MNALLRAAGLSVSIVALGLLTSGCKDDKTVTADDAGADDAGSQKALLGGKLGAAVAAAESSSRQPAAASAPGDGPPEAGFFPPGGADKAQPGGAPAKVEVLSDGVEPRVALVTAPPGEQQARVLAGYRVAGQQANLPPFDFTLSIKAEKAKGKDDKPEPQPIVAKIVSVQIPGLGGKLPKELTDGLDKLKGGEIRYKLTPDGAMLDVTTSMPKDKDKGPGPEIAPLLDLAMRGLVEAVTLATVPLPKKPVGVGGYWIATDRGTTFGIDVVRYRVFKVQKIDKDQVTLSVDTRQYAVSSEIDLGAIVQNQKIVADRFDSQGKGTITWVANQTIPTSSETSQRTTVTIGGGPKGQPKGGLQVELQTKTGEAEKADKKK
jgi:hypothetical protein